MCSGRCQNTGAVAAPRPSLCPIGDWEQRQSGAQGDPLVASCHTDPLLMDCDRQADTVEDGWAVLDSGAVRYQAALRVTEVVTVDVTAAERR